MTEEEWLDGLRHLDPSMIIKTHFALQEKIKKHYKLRDTREHFEKAVQLCIQQIALAPLTAEAMRKEHEYQLEELNALNRRHGHSERTYRFVLPAHHGYRQYAVILRQQKDFDNLTKIEEKRKREGWAN